MQVETKNGNKREKILLPVIFLSLCFGVALLVRETHTFFCNTNYGFGFLEPGPFLMFFEWGILAALLILYLRTSEWRDKAVLSILLGAGLANTLERLMYGCVADFITLPIIGSQVNVADILITGALLTLLLFSSRKS